ncbi:MAG: type II toxin-antitoxin system Phd/YefM family antitoxin [Chloroflexi bacterium]|nr:type II toxin-antitoxin system Phd/YefM family antitoxin [Chloroflexota bacterium]
MFRQVGIRELRDRASEILRQVREERERYVITYQGRPSAFLIPIDQDALEEHLRDQERRVLRDAPTTQQMYGLAKKSLSDTKLEETQQKPDTSAATVAHVLPIITEPFVRTGLYNSPDQVIKHIVLDYLERQIAWAEARLQGYEQKYQQPFAEWTQTLSGQATIADEDDWMEWEATRDMLEGWGQIKTQIEQSYV